MRLKNKMAYFAASLLLTAHPLFAENAIEQIQLPQCLASKLPSNYRTLAENSQYKIINLPSADLDNLVLLADEVHCGRFINVSHYFDKANLAKEKLASELLQKADKEPALFHYEIKHQAQVNSVLERVSTDTILETLIHLTTYNNRSAKTDEGVEAAEWLKAQFETLARQYGREDTASYFVKTGSRYKQPSVVTVIGKDLATPAVVIGAHMDTLDGRMPGAGDDGSGSASIMEAARALLESKLPLKNPVYFIWYAAEERGLVGSHYVVEEFLKRKIPVKATIQFDMTGFRNDPYDSTMWVFQDYTDKSLNSFVAELIKAYINVPVGYSRCGYGCSDHASWTAEGIPAAFPCETSFEDHNPYIHTSFDTMELLYPEHMANFTKLGLAFAVELAS